MSGWASLSGYLHLKPGGGALSILKAKKRMWCVLEESQGRLLYFKSEDDARSKPPLGYVELRGAAITLDMDNINQFVIIVDNKDVLLTAENHESMMIWLMALQARRDQFTLASKSRSSSTSTENDLDIDQNFLNVVEMRERSASDLALMRERADQYLLSHGASISHQPLKPLEGVQSLNLGTDPLALGYLGHSPEWRRNQLKKMGNTIDSGHPSEKMHLDKDRSRSLPPLLEDPPAHVLEPSSRTMSSSVEMGFTTPQRVQHQNYHNQLQLQQQLLLQQQQQPLPLLQLPAPDDSEVFTYARNSYGDDRDGIGGGCSAGVNNDGVSGGGGGSGCGGGASMVSFVGGSSTSASTDTSDDVGGEAGQLQRQQQLQHLHHQHLVQQNNSNFNSTSSTPTLYQNKHHQRLMHRIVARSVSDRGSRNVGSMGSIPIVVPSSGQASPNTRGSTSEEGGERISELEKELIRTKVELAKVLNRQTTFQEILKQKDEIIEDMDGKLGSPHSILDGYDSKKRTSALNKEHQERVRVLQNQNRFLNEEVRRLAKLRGQEHGKMRQQDGRVRSLEANIEVWKLEYISLIQSSIRFTGTDTIDDAELYLFGGDRHKDRILELLCEARKINPSLPTYEYLASGEVHVDCYGFKHHFEDDGLLLHYLCQELSQHFLSQANTFEKHQKNWLLYLKQHSKNLLSPRKELKALVRAGIPDPHRKQMWRAFVMAKVEDIVLEKGPHYYRTLCNSVPDSPTAARYKKQIGLDLMRTMPSNVKFSTAGSKGIMDLQDVLLAFCMHNSTIGYCQGMNFLVAMALLFMDAQDAFWTLVAVTERYHSPAYFDHNLLGAQADQSVLHDLMAEKLPVLTRHLDAIDIEISTVTLNWFLAIFFDAVPFQTLLRVWDCFLLEGPKVLFRFSLAILHTHRKEIIIKSDTISVMRHLKACARISYDVDGLVRTAFKTLKPFPRRQDIVSKQTFYLNALKEKYRCRDLQRAAYVERDNLLGLESDSDCNTGFECCIVNQPGAVWVAYSEPPVTRICVVDCTLHNLTDTGITLEGRVTSMETVGHEMVLIGTMSWYIHAFSQTTRVQVWQHRLHDAVLTMQVFHEDGETTGPSMVRPGPATVASDGQSVGHSSGAHSHRLFAGLADGTVAVLENISMSSSTYDMFYLPIGQSPVTCIRLLGNHLWCACGNTISIIHASTLDPVDRFNVSANPYDTVLSLVPGLPGVWVSVRGSSVLELWDPANLSCKMLYDTRTGRYPNLRKEDDTYFNAARITSILALDHSVWVGTGEGTLITFDVFTQAHKTPSDCSDYLTDNAILPVPLPLAEDAGKADASADWSFSEARADSDSYSRLVEVEKRVRDLYAENVAAEPSEEDDIENKGQNSARNSASGYYSNSSNACNDVVAGNVRSKACNGSVVVVADNDGGERGCGTSSINGSQKQGSAQENGSLNCGEGSVACKSSTLSTNHNCEGACSLTDQATVTGDFSNSTKPTVNQVPMNVSQNSNEQKGNSAANCSTTDAKQGAVITPSPVYIPPQLVMNRQRPVLSKSDSMDSRRTSNVSGSTDASWASYTCDSGYLPSTGCRTSESSGAAASERQDFSDISKSAPVTQNKKVIPTSTSSAIPIKSGFSGEDEKNAKVPESGNITNGFGKMKKKFKSKKSSTSAAEPTPVPTPDLYYLFRPDLSSERKPKESPHCDGYDENKNRRCFCGTIGSDPLGSHMSSEAKTNTDNPGQTVSPNQSLHNKSIEGCTNGSFLSQPLKDTQNEEISEFHPAHSNENTNHSTNDNVENTPDSQLQEENDSPSSPPPVSQHSGIRSDSLDSNKTTGSDDVFQNSGLVDITTSTIKYATPKTSLSDTTATFSCDLNDVANNLDLESHTSIPKEEKAGKDCTDVGDSNSSAVLIPNGSAHINSKLELMKSNLDNVVAEAESKISTNKTLHFKSEHVNTNDKVQVQSEEIIDSLNTKNLNKDSILNEVSSPEEQKTFSAFSIVKSLAAKFETPQDKKIPSKPKDKSPLRRTVSLEVTKLFGHSKVSSDRSGLLHRGSLDVFSDGDEEVNDVKNDSSYLLIEHNGSGDPTEFVTEHVSINSEHKDITKTYDSDLSPETVKDQSKTSNHRINGLKHETFEPHAQNGTTANKDTNKKQQQAPANNTICNNNRNFTNMKSQSKAVSSASEIINQKNNINSIATLRYTRSTENHQVTAVPSQPKLTNPYVAASKIDTKFYGDSDEDTSVHEARVQSFKDSYKRISATSSKAKIGSPDMSKQDCNEATSPDQSSPHMENGKGDRDIKLNIKNGSGPVRISKTLPHKSVRPNLLDTSSDSHSSPLGSPKTSTTPAVGVATAPKHNASATSGSTSNGSNVNMTRSNSNKNFKTITSPTTSTTNISNNPKMVSATISRHGSLPSASSSSSISTVSSPGGGGRPTSLGRKFSDISSSVPSIHGNFRTRDPGARWRLDYTNIQLDSTDQESLAMFSVSREGPAAEQEEEEVIENGDSRRLSCLSTGSDMKKIRLSQFLKDTAESFTSQFGHAFEEEMKLGHFLSTPTLSGCGSVSWSSYDEISTPPAGTVDTGDSRDRAEIKGFPRPSAYSHGCSRSTSRASTMELCYSTDLSLLSKNKISVKPVKGLVSTMFKGKPLVLSFAGSQSDDEAVLIWTREANETLWTNCPVFAYNPATKTSILPSYMRTPLSRSNSSQPTSRGRNISH